jgi:hypothetical protein
MAVCRAVPIVIPSSFGTRRSVLAMGIVLLLLRLLLLSSCGFVGRLPVVQGQVGWGGHGCATCGCATGQHLHRRGLVDESARQDPFESCCGFAWIHTRPTLSHPIMTFLREHLHSSPISAFQKRSSFVRQKTPVFRLVGCRSKNEEKSSWLLFSWSFGRCSEDGWMHDSSLNGGWRRMNFARTTHHSDFPAPCVSHPLSPFLKLSRPHRSCL